MQRPCDVCGTVYEAQRSTSKYCSKRCNVRAAEARKKHPARRAVEVVPLPESMSMLAAVTARELEAAGKLDTVIGQQAIRLAEKMASQIDTGSATAAVSRELRAVMAEALADVTAAADPMDELAGRRGLKASA